MDDEKKNLEVLSTDDIRKNAVNWTLAGDVGLLAHLNKFSEDVCSKTQETQKHLNDLIDNYDEVYAKIGNITNQFLALQNSQFVENRVYDEETPTEEKVEVKEVDEVEQEKLLLLHYKEAVEVGVKLLDTHFHEVQLPPNSDSDDDEVSAGNTSLIWRPKNPYAYKKFPLLIGSAEWWADDKVGLGNHEDYLDTDKMISESESDVESIPGIEKGDKHFSSSSSMENIKPIPKKHVDLKSSSEDIFGLNKDEFITVDSDAFVKKPNALLDGPSSLPSFKDDFAKADEKLDSISNDSQSSKEEKESLDENREKRHMMIGNAFTRELAAKLGSVHAKNDDTSGDTPPLEEPKKKPISDIYNLFGDGDEANDLFSEQITNKPKNLSGGDSLFFDAENDDQLFSGSKNLFYQSATDIFDSDAANKSQVHSINNGSQDATNIKTPPTKNSGLPKATLVNNLFEDLDDDDTLFSSKPNKVLDNSLPPVENIKFSQESGKENNDKLKGLFYSIDDEFDDDLPKKNMFDDDFNKTADVRIKNSWSSSNALSPSEEASRITTRDTPLDFDKSQENLSNSVKRPSEPSPVSTYKANISAAKEINKNITDDHKTNILGTDEGEDDLFSSFSKDKLGNKTTKGIFSWDDDDTALFTDKSKQQDTVSVSSSRSSIFDDVSVSKSRLASVFEKDKSHKTEDDLFNLPDDPLFGEGSAPTKTKPTDEVFPTKTKTKKSLFDDLDDTDDLFGVTKNNVHKEKPVSEKLFDKEKQESKEVKKQEKSDIFGEEEPVRKAQPQSLFDGLEDDDLFKNTLPVSKPVEKQNNPVKEKPIVKSEKPDMSEIDAAFPNKSKLREVKSDIFEEKICKPTKALSEHRIFGDDVNDDELFTEEKSSSDVSNLKPKPPSSLSLVKGIPSTENLPKVKPSGKLNISSDLKSRLEFLTKHAPLKESKQPEGNTTASFDESVEPSTNLLKCPSKDRVKIPVRRRPQSRRARQEAIRNSGVDFDIEKPENFKPSRTVSAVNVSQPKEKNSPESLVSSLALSNPLSPSTDEEDYFNVPELDKNFEKEDQSIFKSNLFTSASSSKLDDNLLFDGAPVISPLSPKKNTSYLESNYRKTGFASDKVEDIEDEKSDLFEPQRNADRLFDSTITEADSLFTSNSTKVVQIVGEDDLFRSDSKKDRNVDSLFDSNTIKDEDNVDLFSSMNIKTEKKTATKKGGKSVDSVSDSTTAENENQEDELFGSIKTHNSKQKAELLNSDMVGKEDNAGSLFIPSMKNEDQAEWFISNKIQSIQKENKKVESLEKNKKENKADLLASTNTENESDSKTKEGDDPKDYSLFGSTSQQNIQKEEKKTALSESDKSRRDDTTYSLFTSTEKEIDLFDSVTKSQHKKVESIFNPTMEEEDLDDDTLFGSTVIKNNQKEPRNSISVKKPNRNVGSFFRQEVEDDSLFTSNATKKPEKKYDSLFEPVKNKTKVESLFDDDPQDDDDILFKSDVANTKKTEVELFKTKNFDSNKKSLFNIEMDDDHDLFGEKLSTPPNVSKILRENQFQNNKEPEGKDKGNPSFVDPLGLMSGE